MFAFTINLHEVALFYRNKQRLTEADKSAAFTPHPKTASAKCVNEGFIGLSTGRKKKKNSKRIFHHMEHGTSAIPNSKDSIFV